MKPASKPYDDKLRCYPGPIRCRQNQPHAPWPKKMVADLGFTIGAEIITNTILGVPYDNYSIMAGTGREGRIFAT